MDNKTKNSNNEPSNYIFGLKLSPNNSDKAFLIEFETDKKESLFIVVGENQRFYDLNFFEDLQSGFNSDSDDANFECLQKYFSFACKEAKNFEIGDKIEIGNSIFLTVKNMIIIKLGEQFCSNVFSKKSNYTFFLSNLTSDEKSVFISFMMSLFAVGSGSFVGIYCGALILKTVFRGRQGRLSSAYIAKLATLMSMYSCFRFVLDRMIKALEPSPIVTQSGKVTLAKTDYLSKIMNQLQDYNINFAKVEFINDKNLLDINDLIVDEVLVDSQGNSIKDEKGNTAHLFIVNSQGEGSV